MMECKDCKYSERLSKGIYKFGASSMFNIDGKDVIKCTKDSVSNLTFDTNGMM